MAEELEIPEPQVPQTDTDNLQKLHSRLVKDGYDLPNYDVFKKDMSDPTKLQRLHTTLIKDKYELPDINTFSTDMGYNVKKKESPLQSSVIPTKSVTPSSENNKGFLDLNTFGEAPKSASQNISTHGRGVAPIRDNNLPDIQEAVTSTVNKRIKDQRGVYDATLPKPTKVEIAKETEFVNSQIKNGNLVADKNSKGESVLKRGTGFLQSFNNSLESEHKQSLENTYVANLPKEKAIEYLNNKRQHPEIMGNTESDTAPNGIMGEIGGFLGSNIGMIAKGTAGAIGGTVAAPETGGASFGTFLATVKDMAHGGYANSLEKNYNGLKQQHPEMSDAEAYDKAHNAALIGEAVNIGQGALLAHSLPTPKASIPPTSVLESLGHAVKTSPKVVGSSGAGSLLNDVVSNVEGNKVSGDEMSKNALEHAKGMAVMHFGLWGLTEPGRIPSYIRPQIENVVASAPREEVKQFYDGMEQQGALPEGTTSKVLAKLDEFDKQKKVVEDMPLSEEQKASITGKLLQRKKIEEENKTLKNYGGSFNARVDANDKQMEGLDSEIDGIIKTGNVARFEKDNLTGEPVTNSKPHEELTKSEREGIVVPKEYGTAEVIESGEGESKTFKPKATYTVKEGGLEISKPIKIEEEKNYTDKDKAQAVADEALGKHYYENAMPEHEKPLAKEKSVSVIKPEDNKPLDITTIAPKEHVPETKKSGVSIILPKHETEIQQPAESESNPVTEPNKVIEPTEENAIGVSKAETKKQREERGLGDMEVQDTRGLKDMFASGKGMVEDGHIDPRSLAESVAKTPRNLHSDEINALLYDRMRIINEHRAVMNEILNSIKDGDVVKERELRERGDKLEQARVNNERAVKSGARENALALSTMQNMIKEDYSLASQKAKALIANNGEPLAKDVQERLERYDNDLQAAQLKLEEHAQKIKDLSTENEVLKAKKEVTEERKRGKAIKKEEIKAERKEIIERLKAIAKSQAGKLSVNPIPIEMIPVLGKLIRNLVRDGIVELDDIVKNIHDELKEFIDGVTERDVRDAITGYGKPKQLSKNEIEKQVREIKRQGRLVSSIEDVIDGERPKRSGLNREEDSHKVKRLKKELEEEMRKAGMILDKKAIDPETEFKTKLEAYKKRLQTQLKDYEERIANNDYAKEEKKPIELDKEGLALKAKVEEVKARFDAERKRIENANKPKLEKRLNALTAWRRFVILSNIPTLGKLGAAVAYRSATSFMEEIVGTALKHVPGLNKIAEKAGREGSAIDPARELRSLRELATKGTLADIKTAIKTGNNSLDYAFSDKAKGEGQQVGENSTWLDFFGRVHKALKTPAQRAEFIRAYDIRAKKAAEAGIDMSDVTNQFEVGTQAYQDSLRAIFMQENIATKGYNNMVSFLEKSGDKGRIVAAFMKTILPIIKVPTNFVAEASSYEVGALKAAWALRKGIKDMTPEQADYVMRALKKQGIGAAVLALGYLNPQAVGGYYTGKRKDYDLKAGDLYIFGMKMPHWMIHAPLLEMLQFGATIRRARDAGKGWSEGALEGNMGLIKQVPFATEPVKLMEATGNLDKLGAYFGDLSKSMVIPPDVQRIARNQDTDAEGNTIQRKPKGLVEHIESGLPVLRKKVPNVEQRKQINEINSRLKGKEYDDLREELIKGVMEGDQ